jgi:DNA-binding MarR family transcriptional regulator
MSRDVARIQRWYPQIYLACHTRHERRASSAHRLSPRDSSLLAHLDDREPITPTELARHVGIGKPTLSAALKRLVRLGYVDASKHEGDRRVVHLRLAPAGAAAMQGGSVLETARVRRLLKALTPAERRTALAGLSLLAKAARRIAQPGSRIDA